MIYISKKSKRTGKETKGEYTPAQAREFLLRLETNNFVCFDYFILGADSEAEISSILGFFVPNFLIKEQGDIFDVYKVNGSIYRKDRRLKRGASFSTLRLYKKKIQDEVPDGEVKIEMEDSHFEIIIEKEDVRIKIMCDYQFEILTSLVYNKEIKAYIDVESINDIIGKIKYIFRKPKHYFSKKYGNK